MWKNTVEWSRPQMTKWRMRKVCWIPQSTNTHSQYAIFPAFPLQRYVKRTKPVLLPLCMLPCCVVLTVCIYQFNVTEHNGMSNFKIYIIFPYLKLPRPFRILNSIHLYGTSYLSRSYYSSSNFLQLGFITIATYYARCKL
jgi:hypothetical protein